MNWTKDEERLLQYVSEQPESMQSETKRETYWEVRENGAVGIEEYGFETFQEVQQFLADCTEDSKIALIAGAAAMKGKTLYHKQNRFGTVTTQEQMVNIDIPDFVYTF